MQSWPLSRVVVAGVAAVVVVAVAAVTIAAVVAAVAAVTIAAVVVVVAVIAAVTAAVVVGVVAAKTSAEVTPLLSELVKSGQDNQERLAATRQFYKNILGKKTRSAVKLFQISSVQVCDCRRRWHSSCAYFICSSPYKLQYSLAPLALFVWGRRCAGCGNCPKCHGCTC